MLAIVVVVASLSVGLAAGYADLQSVGALPAAAVLAGGGLLLGLVRPGIGWFLALLAALCVPLLHLAGPSLGLADYHHAESTISAIIFAAGPALAGVMLGTILHRALFGTGSRVSL